MKKYLPHSLILIIFICSVQISFGQNWPLFKEYLQETQFQYEGDKESFDSLVKSYESANNQDDKIEVLFSIEDLTYQVYPALEICIDSIVIEYANTNLSKDNNKSTFLKYKKLKAKALSYLASSYSHEGKFNVAKSLFEECKIIYSELEDYSSLANIHHNYAMMLEDMGDYLTANEEYRISLNLRLNHNDISINTVHTLSNLGLNYHDLGNEEEAINYYKKALETAGKIDFQEKYPAILNNIGISYASLNDYETALRYYQEALSFVNNDRLKAEILINLGNLFQDMDSTEVAFGYYLESEEIAKSSNDFSLKGDICNNLGLVYLDLNKLDLSTKYFNSAIDFYEAAKNNIGTSGAYSNLSEIAYLNGELENAISLNQKALDLIENSNYVDFLWSIYERQCAYLGESGKYEEALGMNQKYDSIYKLIHSYDNQKALISHELKTQYEKEVLKNELLHQFELETKSLEIENQRAKTNLWFSIGLTILLLAILIILIVINRAKQRISSEKLKANEKLTEAIIQSQEDERRRISRELHDGIGAELIAAKFKLISETSREAYSIIDQAITDIRNLSHQLIPPSIDTQSIRQSIEQYITSLKNDLPFEIDCSFLGDLEKLSSAKKVTIYRILQECLSNTIKYAEAQNVSIQLTYDQNEFTMIYEDDGKGFDSKAITSGIGFRNMKSRVAEIGGELEINSTPGHGMSVLMVMN